MEEYTRQLPLKNEISNFGRKEFYEMKTVIVMRERRGHVY